jgi:hypothetical protein
MPRIQLKTKPVAKTKNPAAKVEKIVIAPTKDQKKPKAVVRQHDNTKLTGLSLKQIMNATPRLMINEGKKAIVKSLKHKKSKMGMPAVVAKVQSLTQGAKVKYEAVVIGKEEGIPLYKQKHVLVSCNCSNFLYSWEFALTHWGSSQIKYSNGEHPHTTNPGLLPGCCKHLCALTQVIFENKF